MIARIQHFLASEHLTAPQLAERLGVQRSAISHILLGRNKPSFDMLHRFAVQFPHLNIGWLITGQGSMYNGDVVQKNSTVTDVSNQIQNTPSSMVTLFDGLNDDTVSVVAENKAGYASDAANIAQRQLFSDSVKAQEPVDNSGSISAVDTTKTKRTTVKNDKSNYSVNYDTNVAKRNILRNESVTDTPVSMPNNITTNTDERSLQRVLLLYSDGSFDDYNRR